VQARVGQTVEIPFRGSGWVYLGEVDSRAGVTYTNRQNDPEGMRFGFRLDEQGEFELRFYRQDFIRDYIQNDHVRLIVEEAVPGGSAVVAAPRWPGAEARDTEAAPSGAGNAPGAAGSLPAAGSPDEGIVPVTPPTTTPTAAAAGPEAAAGTAAARQLGADTPPEEFLRRAREAYQAGRIGEALGILDRFRDIYPLGSDEAWWLYGQALEAAGPGRDIKTALEYYRRLVREYPQSPRYADARRRIAYLERFYFNIQ
jgi:TolA-binding protein